MSHKHILLLVLYILAMLLAAIGALLPPYSVRLIAGAVAVLALADVVQVAWS